MPARKIKQLSQSINIKRHLSRSDLQKFNMYSTPIVESSRENKEQQKLYKSDAIPKIKVQSNVTQNPN